MHMALCLAGLDLVSSEGKSAYVGIIMIFICIIHIYVATLHTYIIMYMGDIYLASINFSTCYIHTCVAIATVCL